MLLAIHHHPHLAPSVFGMAKAAPAVLSAATAAAFIPRLPEGPSKQEQEQKQKQERISWPQRTELWLRSPEIKPLSGSNLQWDPWLTSTFATFLSTGFGEIILGDCDGNDPKCNNVAFAQLSQACHQGSAHWSIMENHPTMDGNTAWKALKFWHNGKTI